MHLYWVITWPSVGPSRKLYRSSNLIHSLYIYLSEYFEKKIVRSIKSFFFNENDEIPIQISLKLVPRSPFGNIPTLVRVTGNKPLPETMVTQFTDTDMGTRGRWFKDLEADSRVVNLSYCEHPNIQANPRLNYYNSLFRFWVGWRRLAGNQKYTQPHLEATMAKLQDTSSDFDELLICGICEETYDQENHQAKFLKCHHTYCSECLTKLLNEEGARPAITCPSCRYQTRVPKSGVEGLQTNFYVTGFQESSENTEPPKHVEGCQRHTTQPLTHFCVTCGIPICRDCRIVNHTVKDGHSLIGISKEDIIYLEELNVSNTSMTVQKRNLKFIEYEVALLAAAKETAIKDMETFIKHAHERLEQRKTDLMNTISVQFDKLQESLLDKQRQIEDAVENLHENINQAKYVITTGDLKRLKTISENLKKDKEEIQTTSLNLDLGENYLAFDSKQGFDYIENHLGTLGQLYTKGFLPNTFVFSSTDAKVGHETKLTVEAYDHHGNKFPVSSDSISVQVLDPTDTSLPIVLYANSSECTVTFTPQMSGLYEVSGKFLGERLIGEYTHISVSSINPVLTFGNDDDGFEPWAIAIDNDDCLYVTDRANKLIKKFTADGEFLSQFSVGVHDKDHTIIDIALDLNRGLIFCAELPLRDDDFLDGNTILEFNLEGELQHTYTLTDPWKSCKLALDGNRDIILGSKERGCLFKVDREGNFLSSMGHLKCPGYIAIDKDDNIIVPDEDNDCIYIFNSDGTVRHNFGSSGVGKGELDRPKGIATDGEHILVSEWNNNRIQIFKYDGTLVSMIESLEDPLNCPTGLAVTADGYVYVTNSNCIKKYNYRDISWKR